MNVDGSDTILVAGFFAAWYGIAYRDEMRRAARVLCEWAGIACLLAGSVAGIGYCMIVEQYRKDENNG